MEQEDFLTTIEAMSAAYNVEPTEALYAGYWLGLQDIPLDDLRRAVVDLLKCSKWMPKVAEIRELCDDYRHERARKRLAGQRLLEQQGPTAMEIMREPTMREAYQRCRELSKEGASQQDIRDFLDEFFDTQPADAWEVRA